MNILRLLVILIALGVAVACGPRSIFAQSQVFTPESLASHDGKDGRQAYFAYKGKVYDVTKSSLWKLGEHFGLRAGIDLTGMMGGAPHGDEVMEKVPMVGTFATTEGKGETGRQPPARAWYDAPIRIAGLSLLGWTGVLLGIVFILNFATCFALPWSKVNLPWMGSRPGSDPLDKSNVHLKWTAIHKYFAWATVILGIIHGVIGFMQVFFKQVL